MAAARSLYFWIALNLSLIFMAMAKDENKFIYHGFNEAKLHLDGMAEIHPSGLLQLTNKSELHCGHALYPLSFQFNTSSSQYLSFSTNFVFAIGPSKSINFSGHGMAFVISPSMDFSQALATEYLGLFNTTNNGMSTNHILAIELDTVQSAEFNETNGNHVGIDVNSLMSNESAPATYFSDKEQKNITLELASGSPIQIWIDYNGTEKLLNVTLAPARMGTKPNSPLLSTSINLSEILLDSMYSGFSAATGTRVSDHYILAWSFNKSGKTQSLDVSKLPSLPPAPSLPPVLAVSLGKGSSKISEPIIVILLVAVMVVLITISTGAIYILRKKKYEEVCEDWEREYGRQRFSFKNLYKATKGFKDTEVIGEGGFGKVYKGVLPSSNLQIAVKRVSHVSEQGMKEFVAEIVNMGRLRHRNLVQLRGYCRRRGELLLVYDYMPNGSLHKILYSNRRPNLNWFQRFRILRGVTSGLLYLHEEWEQVVFHRDIKHLSGKLGDFGLARSYDRGSNPQTTNLVGTVGYLAPELIRTGKATTSTDVFAFGAFMLEVACGRRPIEPGKVNLVTWVIDCWKRGDIFDACDTRLEGLLGEEQMEMVLKLGLFCSHPNPEGRPSMRQVMQYLDGDAKLPHIASDSAVIAALAASNEASNIVISFSPCSMGSNISAHTVSTIDSILIEGR